MAGQHFIDPTGPIAASLNAILEIAGDNFGAPYDASTQPNDVVAANQDILLQYDTPGGGKMEGHANPAQGGGIGTAIHSLLMLLSPAINAYAFILPILGVIRGIIEIICAMMNPFAVIKAVIRLFVKWIPPFISLFPPSGGVVLLISTIKAIMALVYYILTEVIPTISLMIDNIKNVADSFINRDDVVQSRLDAAEEKLTSLLKTLIQKIGIMGVFQPVLELIFLILRLLAGFPCEKGDADTGLLPPQLLGDDSSCCDEFCPEVLSDRSKVPTGSGVLLPATFGDCLPFFIGQLITNDSRLDDLEQYFQNIPAQMSCLADSQPKYAIPAGANSAEELSTLKVKISSKNNALSFVTPILDLSNRRIVISHPLMPAFVGKFVDYEIEIDYGIMVLNGVIGLGCHPDILRVKKNISDRFDLTPALVANPEAEGLLYRYGSLFGILNGSIADALGIVGGFAQEEPPFDKIIEDLDDVRDDMTDALNDFIDDLTNTLNALLSRNTKASTLAVSKKEVVADGKDFVNIIVTPRHISGAQIAQNLPAGVSVDVEIISDFGILGAQTFNNGAGTITAKLTSNTTGVAEIRAKVNNEYVVDFNAESDTPETVVVRRVRFVSEAALPIRRRKTKPVRGKIAKTGGTSDKSPGSK